MACLGAAVDAELRGSRSWREATGTASGSQGFAGLLLRN